MFEAIILLILSFDVFSSIYHIRILATPMGIDLSGTNGTPAMGTSIRIVEGVDKRSDTFDATSEYVHPNQYPTGPHAIHFMNGLCITKSVERFEYSVCPFQNVTQKRIGTTRPSLLGTHDTIIHNIKMITIAFVIVRNLGSVGRYCFARRIHKTIFYNALSQRRCMRDEG